MSQIVSIKKYENQYVVYTNHVDDSIEPHMVDSEEEALEMAKRLLGEQEKQSNESSNN